MRIIMMDSGVWQCIQCQQWVHLTVGIVDDGDYSLSSIMPMSVSIIIKDRKPNNLCLYIIRYLSRRKWTR